MAAWASATITGDTLTLAGVLDYETVLEVDKQGQHWLTGAAPAECKIDLGDISYSSSAGIALLLGWLRSAQQQQKNIHFLRIPTNMIALANVGGLDDLLV